MENKDRAFLERLRTTFRVEAAEHMRNITGGLLELEKHPEPLRRAEIIENAFREAHSLKGAARSVNLKSIESVCVPLESVFSALKKGTLPMSSDLFDLLHRSVDFLLELAAASDMEGSATGRRDASRIALALVTAAEGGTPSAEPPTEPKPDRPAGAEKVSQKKTVRVPMERLDALLMQAEELSAIKLTLRRRNNELNSIYNDLRAWKRDAGLRKTNDKEPVSSPWNTERPRGMEALDNLENRMGQISRFMKQDQYWIGRTLDEHLDSIKKAVMLPASSLLELFPKMARDLARDQGKTVELNLVGADIECDKKILEELKDPLVHIVRNSIDHGLQSEAARIAAGKAPQGNITIAFSAVDSSHMEILVTDDGEGIDPYRVREAALKSGALPQSYEGDLDEPEAAALVFKSGLSTSPLITDISGRGLGLAIVREKIEKLGGTVFLKSRQREGTSIRILLPITLATFRGVLVRVGGRKFILPASGVEFVSKVAASEVSLATNQRVVRKDGKPYPLVRLADVLELPDEARPSPRGRPASDGAASKLNILFLGFSDSNLALQVDEVLDEMEVTQRKLGNLLRRVRNIASAAVLENGEVVPVLNVSDLLRSASGAAGASRPEASEKASTQSEEQPSRPSKILVADDSITARSLLKNILETAGYRVVIAVDGADAFARVMDEEFNLVVSDVDMPRMSGLELCKKIRAQKRLSGLPVVLVTAMESREDLERGIDAGADAYIVKSSFDQSNLLDVVRRLA